MHDWSEFGYVIDRERWLSPSEFAKTHDVGVQTLYNKKANGDLPEDYLVTDGRRWYIREDMPVTFERRKKRK